MTPPPALARRSQPAVDSVQRAAFLRGYDKKQPLPNYYLNIKRLLTLQPPFCGGPLKLSYTLHRPLLVEQVLARTGLNKGPPSVHHRLRSLLPSSLPSLRSFAFADDL